MAGPQTGYPRAVDDPAQRDDPALRHDPAVADEPERLRDLLAPVRALVLDADGVFVVAGRPVPGATDALADLTRRGIPWRVLTNTSTASRQALSDRYAAIGLAVPAARITTAASATAAHTASRFAGRPLFVIATPEAVTEFEGQRLLTAEEAAVPDAGVAAVVVGDGGDDLSYRTLDLAFRLVRGGAALLAMHRNPWWLTARGPTLDIGAFVVGLEYAAGVRATVLGKPSAAVFRAAAASLAEEHAARWPGSGRERLPRSAVAMVGDDLGMDVIPARRAGLRGILLLSGRDGPTALARAAARARGGRVADAVATSLAAVVAALP